jgi:hypothetical protein
MTTDAPLSTAGLAAAALPASLLLASRLLASRLLASFWACTSDAAHASASTAAARAAEGNRRINGTKAAALLPSGRTAAIRWHGVRESDGAFGSAQARLLPSG